MTFEELEADARSDRYYEWLDDQPKCLNCGSLWREEGSIYIECSDEHFCDEECAVEYQRETGQ